MFDKKYQLLTLQRQHRLTCRHTNEGLVDRCWDVVAGDAVVGKSLVKCGGYGRFLVFGEFRGGIGLSAGDEVEGWANRSMTVAELRWKR